eukprot:GHVP01056486.1.p1 GENE.GHVP01056486.1~~GHVP01056486.1.p1  ORF type:complete len:130 (+),score=12.54 GHVP01056486.1:157-546(+)
MAKQPIPFSPAPLGMAGFGISTVLLCYWNVTFQPLSPLNVGLAVFFGSLCQYIAGFICLSQNTITEMMVYLSFAGFWLIFCVIEIFPFVLGNRDWVLEAPLYYKGIYCMVWGYLTVVFAITLASISWVF